MAKTIKILPFLIIVAFFILSAAIFYKYPPDNSSPNLPVPTGSVSFFPARDQAISDYLQSHLQLSRKTVPDSSVFCVFENLSSPQALFPLSLWVRCGEFSDSPAELSSISVPVTLDYPNELSYFDPDKFTLTFLEKSTFPAYDSAQINSRLDQLVKSKLVTVFGRIICLTHKDTGGPQTLECAYGIRDSKGVEYGLGDTKMQFIMSLPINRDVVVTGWVKPSPSAKYKSDTLIEIISVSDSAKP